MPRPLNNELGGTGRNDGKTYLEAISVNVRDYAFGATGNGTTDDTLAIQAALDTGNDVYIPHGTYLITAALQLKTTNQRVHGDGQNSILLTTTDIETMYSSTSVFGVVLENLNFNNTVATPTHFHVHFGSGASGCWIKSCGFNTALTGSVVSTSHHAGVWFAGANLNNILDCQFQQSQILMESTDATIRGGFVYAFAFQYAIKITSAGEVVVDSVRGILGGQDKGCIWIPSASYMNKITNNYLGGTLSTINIGKGILADQQQMMQIIGNTFHEIDNIGVHLTTPNSGNVIANNTFWAGDPKQNDPGFGTPGYQDIYIESVAFASSATVIVNNVCNRFVGPVEDGMPGVGKSYAIEVNSYSGTTNNLIRNNSISGARYYSPAILDPNSNDIVGNNAGVLFSGTWTPSDLSGAGLSFTGVSCKFLRTADYVMVWGALTFPATASAAGVTIGGLPTAPISGMEGAIGNLQSTAAAVQKVKLVAAQTYFYFTDEVDVQQTNATCSGKTFSFSGTYLV